MNAPRSEFPPLRIHHLMVLSTMPLAAVIACLVGAAGNDLRNRVDRQWTHWLGASVMISLMVALIGIFGR